MACTILYKGKDYTFQTDEEFEKWAKDNIKDIPQTPKPGDETNFATKLAEELAKLQGTEFNLDKKIQDAYIKTTKQKKILGKKLSDEFNENLSRLIKFLKEPGRITEIRTYAVYLQESAAMLQHYAKEAIHVSKDTSLDLNVKMNKLHFLFELANSYSKLIKDLENSSAFIEDGSPLIDIKNSITQGHNKIKSVYYNQITPIISEILAEGNELSNEKATAAINEQIKFIDERIADRTAKGLTSRVDDLKSKKEALLKFKDKNIPTKELIEKLINGEEGDSSFISMVFEATISSGDGVISSFAKYIKNMLHDLRKRIIPIQNGFQTHLNNFVKDSGRDKGNNAKLYEGFYKVVTRHTNGKPEKYYALMHEFNEDYISDYEAKINEINQLRADNKIDEAKAKTKDLKKWMNTYMEQEFTPQYYATYDLLTDEAKAKREQIFDNISYFQRGEPSANDMEEIRKLWGEYKLLGYDYDDKGNLKQGDDMKIAKSVQAFNAARKGMITYELDDKGRAKFNRIKRDMQDLLASGQITQEKYDQWLRHNTTRKIDQKFYDERNALVAKINGIMETLPKSDKDDKSIKEIWDKLYAITVKIRNEDNVPDGRQLDEERQKLIRDYNQAIEELKRQVTGNNGLTKEESIERSVLRKKFHQNMRPYPEWSPTHTEPGPRDQWKIKNKEEWEAAVGTREQWEKDREFSEADQNRLETLDNKSFINKLSNPIPESTKVVLNGLFQKLSAMQSATTTEYYDETYAQKYDDFQREYTKNNPDATANDLYNEFEKTEWFQNNHYTTWVWQSDGNNGGDYMEVWKPTYAWTEILPTNASYIDKEYPGLSYRTRKVNDQYKNPNFIDKNNDRMMPKRIVDGELSKYVDKDYENLKMSPDKLSAAKYKFLTYMTEQYLKSQENAPVKMGYLIPAIEKGFLDRVQDGQVDKEYAKGKVKGVWEGIKRSLKSNDQDNDIGIGLGDMAGHEFQYVPTRYTGRIDVDNVSLNLSESILKYIYSSERTKVLNEAMPVAKGLQNILGDKKIDVDKQDAIAKSLGFFEKLKKRGSSTREHQVSEFINMVFFNEFEKDEQLFGYSVTKITNNLMKMSALQMLAMNIPAQVTNYVSAYTQAFIESAGKEFITPKNLKDGFWEYKKNLKEMIADSFKMGDKSLLGQMIDLFDVEQGKYESHLGHKSDFSLLKELPSVPYILKNAGEHEIATATFIAMAKARKVKQTNDNKTIEISLYDAYTKDKDGNIALKEGVEFSDKERHQFNNELHGLLRKLNGNYDKINRPWMEKWTAGRLAGFMRKYIVPLAVNRWGSQRYDNEIGRQNQGYYRTFWKAVSGDLIKMRFNVMDNWADYTDVEKRDIIKTLTELSLILLMTTMVWLLGGYDDDKDGYKKNSFLVNHILYQLMKVKSETENFMPGPGFNEIYKTVTTPTVAIQSIKNLYKTVGYMEDLFDGNETHYKKDMGFWDKGDSKITAMLAGMVGFKGNSLHPDILIKNFNNAQKIR